MDWPPQRLELNIIELLSLWDYVGREQNKRQPAVKGKL